VTTCQDLIEEARRYLMSTVRDQLNVLTTTVGTSDTTWTLTYDVSGITAGDYLSIGLEVVYVWSVNTANTQVTVQRAMRGSTAAAHTSGALITVNPRFSDFAIFNALNSDLDDLSPSLFKTNEVTVTYNPAVRGYDLTGVTATVLEILRVRHDTPGPWKDWPEIHRFQLKRDQPTADFPSGYTLALYEAGWPGLDVRVTYSSPFTHFTAATDDATTTGMSATMFDIPALGAGARLSAVQEVARNFTQAQADPRRATEVPPNAQLAGSTALTRLRAQRIQSEVLELRRLYPYRVRAA
jgi:hypothetical protein